jgi:hypothetical protein
MAFQRKPVMVVDVAAAADCWMGTTKDQSVAEVMALVRASQALATSPLRRAGRASPAIRRVERTAAAMAGVGRSVRKAGRTVFSRSFRSWEA